jgi:chemotaxis response regulator CheB
MKSKKTDKTKAKRTKKSSVKKGRVGSADAVSSVEERRAKPARGVSARAVFPVVGIGGSAGGLDAFKRLLSSINSTTISNPPVKTCKALSKSTRARTRS